MTATNNVAEEPIRHVRRTIVRSALAVIALVLIVWAWPTRFGGNTTVLAVEGSSMRPTFNNGDLVIARAQNRYKVGDIIVFTASTTAGHSANVVHRVIAVEADGTVITQGDNRRTADGFHTTARDIIGRAQWRIPHGATTLRILSRWWLLALLTGGLVTVRLWPDREPEADARPPRASTDRSPVGSSV